MVFHFFLPTHANQANEDEKDDENKHENAMLCILRTQMNFFSRKKKEQKKKKTMINMYDASEKKKSRECLIR